MLMQYILIFGLFLFSFACDVTFAASTQSRQVDLAPHKALYDISLTSKSSGSQIVNIKGKMFYETKSSCGGWVTHHQFNIRYEYADGPGMAIKSDFSTYESFDGGSLSFSTRRLRDGEVYEEYRGQAIMNQDIAEANFSVPEGGSFELPEGAVFPVGHTRELIRQARRKTKFFKAVVFDGSDSEGPVDINSFIGELPPSKKIASGKKINSELLEGPAWPVRMAVFPVLSESPTAEYEMSMVFHDNGIVSDMDIDYGNFSVRQELTALEEIEPSNCDNKKNKHKNNK